MASKQRTARDRLLAENVALRARLAESEETLRAIREGEVDAVIVSGSKGDRVFALSEAENLPRVMVETMNEAGLAIAPDGLIVFCNNRACVLLHRTKDRLLGHNAADFVAPEDAKRFRKLVRAATAGNADARITFISETGSLVPMHVWASHLRRPEGPLISLVGTDLSRIEADQTLIAELQEQKRQLNESRQTALKLKDEAVRARKEMERINAALRASEDRIQQALQVGRSFTFDWHPPSDKVLRSSSCATILGMSAPKACRSTGQKFLDRVQPDDRARLLKVIGSLTPEADSYALEYRFNRDDGRLVVIDETGRATFDAAGSLVRVVGVSSDISARRNAEDELRKLNARLESLVRARTAEVERQREDLRRLACRIASIQDEEQRRIAEGLHDGVAQLLVTGTFKLAQWGDSTSSRKSKEAILEIEGLIFEALKSIRTMTFDFAAATLAQLGLAKALEELCHTMTERHGIRFAFECRGKMRRLTKQSATVLFKAAREMMFNVIKHADVKKATVMISNRRGECRVAIEDHGKGFKACPGEAVGHHPAGIGILSAMERMRTIGGRVTIKTAPGAGTKVSLILPAPRTKKRQNGVARH